MAEKKTYGRSREGAELSEEVLQQMAEKAQAGLDVIHRRLSMRRPGRHVRGLRAAGGMSAVAGSGSRGQ